ncbi:restriction endonuclease subunit S [Lutibacter sp. A80]|uniref:restriction endonuclease subunit S n=1 Tax=Lutibacter sp. A80 TaxID=2918453 RepID=UPI001F051ABB|nr:restriction endonuclease subunit S [Lutibacter sp. A80]UMB59990.1 restriction endonuclease subunit S [Lutibacter sp. A80]
MDTYKKSPLGIIPIDWEVLLTNDVGEITSSKRVYRGDYTKNGIPFFRGKEISQLAKGDKLKDIVYIKTETYNELKSKFGAPKSGDILVTAVGTIGSVYLVKEGDKFYFKDGNLMWIRKITDRLNRRFLMHYLRSNIFQKHIDLASGGSSQKALTIVKFKRLFIPVPSCDEQQKIAEILSTVDAKIDIIDQQITETQDLKKGLMQRLLTKGIGHTEFKDSALGEIPVSWEVVKIGDVLKLGSGKDYKHLQEGSIPVYGTGGIMTYVNEYLYDGESVGIGRKGTIDKPVFLNDKFWTVDTLFYTHSFKGVIPFYIYVVFQSINWRKHSEATGVPSLSRSIIEPLKILLPPMIEQSKIVEILTSVDEKLEVLSEKKTTYQELKKGLMQQLLTGKVRVKV